MELEKEIKNEELLTKCKWSPFEGMKLKGFVERTFVNGRLVYDDGNFDGSARGREVRFYG